MTVFQYPLEAGDTAGQRFERIKAVVDTAASYTQVKGYLLRSLGHEPTDHEEFELANGATVELGTALVPLRIDGKKRSTYCIFGNDDADNLLGATTLENFALGVDPRNHTLIPVVLKLLDLKSVNDDDDND